MDQYNSISYYKDIFDKSYTSIGFLKWGSKDENIYVEMNLDMKYMDLLVINIKPLY